jgi:hypothetical protein
MIGRKHLLSAFFAAGLGFALTAQHSDAGFWAGADVTYDYTKRISFNAEAQTRFGQGFSRYQKSVLDVGGRYELNRLWRVAVTYRVGHALRYDDR